VLLLLACNMSEGTFYKKGFQLSCEQWEACDADDFGAHYESVDDCFDAEWARAGTYVAEYENEGCTFDPHEARSCIDALGKIECETWMDEDSAPEACFFVWDCPTPD
jgi:hypothetical protein